MKIDKGRVRVPEIGRAWLTLVDNHDFGTHTLELSFDPGTAGYAFTFTNCVDLAESQHEANA